MVAAKVRKALLAFPDALSRLGLVDRRKGREAVDLATPAMLSDGMRTALRTVDFLMVSVAVGETAVAAMELGFQYYFISFGLALAVSSGTISVVSRLKGTGDHEGADFAVKQSLWLALLVSAPIALLSWEFSREMIALLTDDPETVALGAVYLEIVMLSVPARFWSNVASRALAGAGDTRTPLYVRTVSVPTNALLNAALIFGVPAAGIPSLGLAGAAWGTWITNVFAAAVFLWLLVSGRFDVRLPLGGRQWDTDVAVEIVRVGLPLAGNMLLRTLGQFPFLFVLGVLGTPVLAAYAIARRVMFLALMPAWGYATASSTLVGQAIGAGDDEEADDYGWQTLRVALATQLAFAAVIVALARPIAVAFDTEYVDLTVQFVRVFGVGVAGYSAAETMRGGLRGAGDTRWPLYASVLGTYVLRLPVAFLALPAGTAVGVAGVAATPGVGLGLAGVYAALVVDMYARAAVNVYRFRSDRWKVVARESALRTGPETTD